MTYAVSGFSQIAALWLALLAAFGWMVARRKAGAE
jgi:hypothetical protein